MPNSSQNTDENANRFRALWDLGYHRLVPIIPPDAPISERSSIAVRIAAGDDSRGKTPGVKGDDGKWRGISLVAMESQEQDLDKWHAMGASVGVKLGEGLVALDIDTTNPDAARKCYELAAKILGPAAIRFGNRPKCLMLYEAPHDTGYKQLRFATPTEPWIGENQARGGARVELLTEGRQFVAQGIHPGTRQPYAWPQNIPKRAGLTTVSAEQIDEFMRAAAEALGGSTLAHRDAALAPEQESLLAPDWETLRRTVESMPNTSALFPARDDYVKVAYAIKAAAPEGFEYEARDLYLDWTSRWDEGENDPDIALRDWERAKPPYRTGYSFLTAHAPGLFFEACGEGTPEGDKVEDMFAAAAEATKPALLPLMGLSDIRTAKRPRFLIGRHIPETGLGFMYGEPGSKKTFFLNDMALHLAYGLTDWHGDKITQRERGGVLYIAGEGASGFQARIEAWHAGRFLPEGVEPDIKYLFHPVNFMRPEDIKLLIATVKAYHPDPLSIIFVDTVSRAIPGADENLQKDMTLFIAACEALRAATGAFVMGAHHASKAGDMRGSTVFLGAGDVVLRTEKKPDGITHLQCVKMKDGEDGWHDAYRMESVVVGQDEDGDDITSLVPHRATKVEVTKAETALQQRWAEILWKAASGCRETLWRPIEAAVGKEVNRTGLLRRTSLNHVRDEAVRLFAGFGGAEAELDGQTVHVTMTQAAKRKPWTIRFEPVSIPADEGEHA